MVKRAVSQLIDALESKVLDRSEQTRGEEIPHSCPHIGLGLVAIRIRI